jgi:hypothetical protein
MIMDLHNQLARSSVTWSARPTPATVLKILHVPFKKIKGKTFWSANEQDLEYVYHDFIKAIPQALKNTHPDRIGGEHDAFIELKRHIDALKRSFNRHGIGNIDPVITALRRQDDHCCEDRRKIITCITDSTPVSQITDMIIAGARYNAIARTTGVTFHVVECIAKSCSRTPKRCLCGKQHGHVGKCQKRPRSDSGKSRSLLDSRSPQPTS